MRGFLLSFLALSVLTAAERPRLLGLKKIAVVVAADPLGNLDTHQLQASVEAKLREAGLRIDSKSKSRLNVTVGVSDIRAGNGQGLGFAYSIHVSVSQQVYLAHNTNVMTDAVTWEGLWLGVASKTDLGKACAQSIDRRLNDFVAVYQAGLEEEDPAARATARR
jgi:superfamily I DNA and RNA helicase